MHMASKLFDTTQDYALYRASKSFIHKFYLLGNELRFPGILIQALLKIVVKKVEMKVDWQAIQQSRKGVKQINAEVPSQIEQPV